jgi:hypothetical protein
VTGKAKEIVETWLDASLTTAHAREHAEHMDLISKTVSLLGVPGFEVIKYDDWSRQCKDEFEEEMVKHVRYERTEVIAAGMSLIIFRAVEIIEVEDGPEDRNGIEGTLVHERDGKWRLTQERILSAEEAERYQIAVN